jgi:hypothetical protein
MLKHLVQMQHSNGPRSHHVTYIVQCHIKATTVLRPHDEPHMAFLALLYFGFVFSIQQQRGRAALPVRISHRTLQVQPCSNEASKVTILRCNKGHKCSPEDSYGIVNVSLLHVKRQTPAHE